jgi:hypothetical protein
MTKYLKQNLLYLLLILISSISLFGAGVYYFYALNNTGVIISLTLSIPTFFTIFFFHFKNYKKDQKTKYFEIDKKTQKNNSINKINFLLSTFYFLLVTFYFFTLYSFQTTTSIISPWQVIPKYIFLIYFLSTLILIILTIRNFRFSKFLIPLQFFMALSVAWIVYKIGYGYDSFIHEATMQLIDKTGAVFPKPFYYLGQYSLIIILHKISYIPITWLNTLLVPVSASIFIPLALFKFAGKWFNDRKNILLLAITILVLPFSFFIATTPQNLSYLFLILVVLFGLTCQAWLDLLVIYLLAFTALVIHPIAGIPAILFTLSITVYNISPYPYEGEGRLSSIALAKEEGEVYKKYLYGFIYFLSVIALPIAFYFINQKENPISENISVAITGTQSLREAFKTIIPNIPASQNFILNFAYLYFYNLKFIILLLSLTGIIIILRNRKKCRLFYLNLGMSLAMLSSYFIATKINFNFLINYEQSDYANRLLGIAVIFLLPIIIIALYKIISKISEQPNTIKIPILIFIALTATTSLYASYPRFDNYFNSRGYSTGQNDIDAVKWIENNHINNYIVLANQQVSAAALSQFGFNNYIIIDNKIKNQSRELGTKIEIYNYPIPTSSPLYQYYLKMVYEKPNKKTMEDAMDFAGVNEAYFVLNKYWYAFPKVLEEAKLEANNWQEIGNGEVFIFKYSR